MRVAFAVPSLGFSGGLERYAHTMARGLRARGHAVLLAHGAAIGRDPRGYSQAFDAVAPLDSVGSLGPLDAVYVQKARAVDELAVWGATPALLAAHDHDLSCPRSHRYLPMSHEPCDRAPGLACVRHGCVVTRERRPNTFPLRVVSPWELRDDLSALARRARIVACSRYVARGLYDAGAPVNCVSVLHPVPPSEPRSLVPQPAAPRLLVVGSLLRGKGFDLAITALAGLDEAVSLDVAGAGPDEASLRALAARVAPGRVRFHGAVAPEQVNALYDQARVVLVPSRWPEPFGMVGLEAMRRARPVVAAAHGGIPEWLGVGSGGALFTPGDATSLARCVRSVLDDAHASAKALAWAEGFTSFDETVRRLESLLEQTIEEQSLRRAG